MASGHIRKLDTGKWQARFPLGERGKFKSKNFDRKLDAERWLHERNERQRNGDWVNPSRGKFRLSEVAEEWFDLRGHLARSTLARDRSYLDSLILPHFEYRHVGDITTQDIEDWIKTLDVAPATVHKAHQILSSVLDRAVKTRRINTNPSTHIEGLPRIEPEEMRFLTVEEVGELADEAGDYGPLIWAGALTGMRWAELVGLKHEYVNREAKTITVAETLVEVNGHLETKGPKTASSKRTIAAPERLLAMLPKGESGLVFTAAEGGPIRRGNFRKRVWKPATEAAGLHGLRFHDLRHTHASWLIEQGVHAKVISTRLGHSSITVTMDRYGHLMEGLDQNAAELLNDLG